MNNVMRKIKEWDLNILESDYNLDCTIKFSVSRKKSDLVFNFFNKQEGTKIKYVKSVK